jgi:hypothetical protein
MKQLITSLVLVLLFVSCNKDDNKSNNKSNDDVLEIHFKVDGKQYSYTLPKNTPNPLIVSTYDVSPGKMYESQGAMYQLTDTSWISLEFGFFLRDINDNPGNVERLKKILPVGNREYNIWKGDSTVSNAIGVIFVNGRESYNSGIPPAESQAGNTFVINEIKQTDWVAGTNNAFIVKGTFNCNLYTGTGVKKVLTDGTYTCMLSTR